MSTTNKMIKALIFLYLVVVVASFVDKNVFDYERRQLIRERYTVPPPPPPSNDFRRRFGRSIPVESRHPDDMPKIEFLVGDGDTQNTNELSLETQTFELDNRAAIKKAWWKKFIQV
ncbi:hypothetical protein Trydic_g4663 [Trypoxylus dichotomus]